MGNRCNPYCGRAGCLPHAYRRALLRVPFSGLVRGPVFASIPLSTGKFRNVREIFPMIGPAEVAEPDSSFPFLDRFKRAEGSAGARRADYRGTLRWPTCY
jgi:hypothetical protein